VIAIVRSNHLGVSEGTVGLVMQACVGVMHNDWDGVRFVDIGLPDTCKRGTTVCNQCMRAAKPQL
jgi:hypothetical protein